MYDPVAGRHEREPSETVLSRLGGRAKSMFRVMSGSHGASAHYRAIPTLAGGERHQLNSEAIAMRPLETDEVLALSTGSNIAHVRTGVLDNPEDFDEGIEPTEFEKRTLRRVIDHIPPAAFAVVFVELCERFAFYGMSGPFQNFIQNPLPPGGNGSGAPASPSSPEPAGALGMGQSTATALNNMFLFISYVFPVFGAILADAKWGRYKTITLSCFVYFVGLLVVTAVGTPASLARGFGFPGWLLGISLIAAGTGGIKCNVSPLVADQYRPTRMRVEDLPSGERVIVDPSLTITRIYNIFYWCINVGSLSSLATTTLERRAGFWAAFLLPTLVFLGTPLLMVACAGMYHRVPPRGSVIVETWRVWRLAVRGLVADPWGWWRDASKTGVWERAKPTYLRRSLVGGVVPSLVTWDDDFVDEVKRTVRACEIFLFFPLYWMAFQQLGTNLVSMGATLTTHGIPNDLLNNVDALTTIVCIPLIDVAVYPALRRVGLGRFAPPGPVVRIWIGFMLVALAMAYSAGLQYWIYGTNPCGGFVSGCAEKSSVSVWWQVPAYMLAGLSEIFASITGLEYSYNKAPKRMKSFVMAVFFLMSALGNVLNIAISPLAVDPKLVWNYALIGLTTFVAGNIFYFSFRDRDAHEEQENRVGRGRRVKVDDVDEDADADADADNDGSETDAS